MEMPLVDRLHQLKPTIEQILRAGGAPGASIGIAHKGSTIFTLNTGFRDVESQDPPDSDTLYGVASLTKAFTGSAISQLVDQGKLQWHSPVANLLPGLDSRDTEVTNKLTIMDLLTHSTGLAMSNQWWYGAQGELLIDASESLRYFNALPQVAGFRQSYRYSNWNYDILGKIIEKVSGMSYGTFVETNIFVPLGMTRSATKPSAIKPRCLATPYAALDDGAPFLLPQPAIWDGTVHAAAQCIRSSVNDMLRYSHALMDAYHAEGQDEPNTNTLSSSPLKLVRHQLECHRVTKSDSPKKGYGLGVAYTELPSALSFGCNSDYSKDTPILSAREGNPVLFSHTGSMAGYTSTWVLLPTEEFAIIVLSNSIGLADPCGWVAALLVGAVLDSPEQNDYVRLAQEAAREHIARTGLIAERLKQDNGSMEPAKPLECYSGQYRHPLNGFLIDIRHNGDGLYIAFQGQDSQLWRLTHLNGDTFLWMASRNEQAKRARFTYSPSNVFKIIFKAGDDGSINQLSWPHEGGLSEDKQCFEKIGEVIKL